MAEASDVGVFDGADEACGHLLFIGSEAGVDGGYDVIQFLEQSIGKIEFSSFENVALRPGKEGALGFLRVEEFDLFDLFFEARGIEPVGLERGFGVIRNAKPLKAVFGAGLGHGGEGILPVAGESVVVKAAADLIAGDKFGELIFFGRSNFSAVLTEFGGNQGEAQGLVEVLFVFEFQGGLGFSFKQTPFAEVKTAIDGPLAQSDIVLFGSCEVSKGGGPNLGGDDPKIAGDASSEDNAGFGIAVGDDFFHVGGRDKSFHDLLRFFGGGD